MQQSINFTCNLRLVSKNTDPNSTALISYDANVKICKRD